MRHFFRLLALTGALVLTVILASGCSSDINLTFNPQELYSLPKLPAKYTELNNRINEILKDGAEYAAPVAGTNIQPVQLRDLNGDGREEALAFFRNTSDEKPLKIYVFTAAGETYEQTAVIEGSGTAIYSIAYNDLDADGQTELIVGWRASTELQALTVYALRPNGPLELVRTDYVKYGVLDLDENQLQELVVLRSVPDGEGAADYYSWNSGALKVRYSVRISMTMAELSQQGRVTRGTLCGGEPALFITGVVESARTVTDILAIRNGELTNVVLSAATGVSTETAVFRSLYPTDINGDGLTEVPKPAFLPAWENSTDFYQRIDWSCYTIDGKAETVMSTYHDTEDGWYFQLPEKWFDQILVSRSVVPDEAAVTFYIRNGRGQASEPFLRIVAITGTSRENRAVRGNRFNLVRKAETIYVAELLEANETWEYGMTEDEVRAAFSLITGEWTEGDN
ncbi:VCBS repeat-containing protein [Oscillibacter sp.]|uniref:FG-GAP repeat domain-containing protein n=1 Tax=Oscillibacter sp. TaxID=1945593 RepID=UPI00260E9F24|nr:VCBS repeat-containing protein [Oscillibacter sp.]MDD3346809.1 VCBS repeat-containing protein [Oscillibacter sp.]